MCPLIRVTLAATWIVCGTATGHRRAIESLSGLDYPWSGRHPPGPASTSREHPHSNERRSTATWYGPSRSLSPKGTPIGATDDEKTGELDPRAVCLRGPHSPILDSIAAYALLISDRASCVTCAGSKTVRRPGFGLFCQSQSEENTYFNRHISVSRHGRSSAC